MLWLAVLAKAGAAAMGDQPPLPTRIDLLAKSDCSPADTEVVVCGRREDQRLRPLASPRRPAGPPDGALSARLPGGGSGKLRAATTELPGGRGSGAAVTLIFPF